MSRPPDLDWTALAQAFGELAARRVPGWTELPTGDPGITLLDLFAFLAEQLAHGEAIPEGAAGAVARIEHALSRPGWRPAIEVSVNGEPWARVGALKDAHHDAKVFTVDETGAIVFGDGSKGRRPPAGSRVSIRFRHGAGGESDATVGLTSRWPLPASVRSVAVGSEGAVRFEAAAVAGDIWSRTTRLRYFEGQLLTAADFRDEQAYHLRKHRRHLATVHGSGVAHGLNVEASPDQTSVTIGRGVAFDRDGRELLVPDEVSVAVPAETGSPAYVVLTYNERLVDRVPVSGAGSGEAPSEAEATRIEEGCRILVSSTVPLDGVGIARLSRSGQGWRVDTSYDPPRTR